MDATRGEHENRFDRLFDAHAPAVSAYCRRRTSAADAQDALAEVFAVAWRRLEDVPVGDGGRPWLLGVARRVLANQRRSLGRQRRLFDTLTGERPRRATTADAAETVTIRHADDRAVIDAINRLPARDREVLTLVAWEGLTRNEAARVVGCSPEAAKKRFQRAARRLRDELGPDQPSSPPDRPTDDSRRAPEGGG